MNDEKDLAHWAAGSNKEPVKDGVEDVDQSPELFEDEA